MNISQYFRKRQRFIEYHSPTFNRIRNHKCQVWWCFSDW